MLKTVLPAPDPTVLATPLFLGDLLSLPEIETLWVNESESNSTPCKRLKTDNAGKECMKAKAKCNKLLGRIRRRKDMKAVIQRGRPQVSD